MDLSVVSATCRVWWEAVDLPKLLGNLSPCTLPSQNRLASAYTASQRLLSVNVTCLAKCQPRAFERVSHAVAAAPAARRQYFVSFATDLATRRSPVLSSTKRSRGRCQSICGSQAIWWKRDVLNLPPTINRSAVHHRSTPLSILPPTVATLGRSQLRRRLQPLSSALACLTTRESSVTSSRARR